MQELINLAPTLAPSIVIIIAAMLLNREWRKARNGGSTPISKHDIETVIEKVVKKHNSLPPPPSNQADFGILHDRQEAQGMRLNDYGRQLGEVKDDVREVKKDVKGLQRGVDEILDHITKGRR
ncbi:MAG: hypothetical protein KJ995_08220 [Candidatus Omnitrophica bacterium]|nr:hypothetical protein [Candidatus Omnitrophota bacterium]MBU1657401.1 hypothetical protein [Candidatus Omnitrophota bacterium]MBU1785289.1 hypothetical protein [Candidatus Omnitrophota bacterium]MBU1852372.1 hypothetical protein [Candidatus Omnitrophota bacterium]